MSRTQDTLALLRGAQKIVDATARHQQRYLRGLWANSSVRELLEQNIAHARTVAQNPCREVDTLSNLVKETVERTAVVVEGVKQYSMGARNTETVLHPDTTTASIVDIPSITLKELEELLYRRKTDNTITPVEIPVLNQLAVSEIELGTTYADPKLFTAQEENVKEWMSFLAKHDPKSSAVDDKTITPLEAPKSTLENVQKITPIDLPSLSSVAKQRKVPSSRIGRMASFGTLFAGLGLGTASELAKGALGLGGSTNVKQALFSQNNAERIVDTLCKVRGAALKIGQILSIQDSALVSPEMLKAFDRVRQAADYMPNWQVEKVMSTELGKEWRSKLQEFDEKPFAAASIGQVHRAVLLDGTEVALKIQYPGVAKSIESDIDNLVSMLKVWDVFPAGFFIDNIVKVNFLDWLH